MTMIRMTNNQSSLETLWQGLRNDDQFGGSRRVDPTTQADFYASLDQEGRAGLTLVTDRAVPEMPRFDALDISVAQRSDGRRSIGLWLSSSDLERTFATLCDSVVAACASKPPDAAPQILARKLFEWQELLDVGAGGLSGSRLRGLIAELLVLEECVKEWPAQTVVQGWAGPLGAPQDFVLPKVLLEVKASAPSASKVRISSAEQLTSVENARMTLAVVPLSQTTADHPGAFTPADLVGRIVRSLAADLDASRIFLERLASYGYSEHPDLAKLFYRAGGRRYFEVASQFPRITTADVPHGVGAVAYDIDLAACTDYEILLETLNGH